MRGSAMCELWPGDAWYRRPRSCGRCGKRQTLLSAAEATLDTQCLPRRGRWLVLRAFHRVAGHPLHFSARVCRSLKRRPTSILKFPQRRSSP